jgi:hypothetical protein
LRRWRHAGRSHDDDIDIRVRGGIDQAGWGKERKPASYWLRRLGHHDVRVEPANLFGKQ